LLIFLFNGGRIILSLLKGKKKMSEKEMKAFMTEQKIEAENYALENAFTGKDKEELMIEWISLYSKQFRENYLIVN
jgi:hypothetical protein